MVIIQLNDFCNSSYLYNLVQQLLIYSMSKQFAGRNKNWLVPLWQGERQSTVMILMQTMQKTNNRSAGAAGTLVNVLHIFSKQQSPLQPPPPPKKRLMYTHNRKSFFFYKTKKKNKTNTNTKKQQQQQYRWYNYPYKILRPCFII